MIVVSWSQLLAILFHVRVLADGHNQMTNICVFLAPILPESIKHNNENTKSP
jgi:hypothetical protein